MQSSKNRLWFYSVYVFCLLILNTFIISKSCVEDCMELWFTMCMSTRDGNMDNAKTLAELVDNKLTRHYQLDDDGKKKVRDLLQELCGHNERGLMSQRKSTLCYPTTVRSSVQHIGPGRHVLPSSVLLLLPATQWRLACSEHSVVSRDRSISLSRLCFPLCIHLPPGKDPGAAADRGKRFWPSQSHPARAHLPGHVLRPHRYPEWHLQVTHLLTIFTHWIDTAPPHSRSRAATTSDLRAPTSWVVLCSGTSLKTAQRSRPCSTRTTCCGWSCGTSTSLRCQRKCGMVWGSGEVSLSPTLCSLHFFLL